MRESGMGSVQIPSTDLNFIQVHIFDPDAFHCFILVRYLLFLACGFQLIKYMNNHVGTNKNHMTEQLAFEKFCFVTHFYIASQIIYIYSQLYYYFLSLFICIYCDLFKIKFRKFFHLISKYYSLYIINSNIFLGTIMTLLQNKKIILIA